jgi:hypothetical protein
VKPATLTIDLQWYALGDDKWCGVLELRGCYGEVRVPLSESVIDEMGGVRTSGVERVVTGVNVFVGNEGREVGVEAYVKDDDGVV